MKKIIFAAIAVCGFAFANAQSPQTSNASISVTLDDAMEVTPASNVISFSGTYANAADYNAATKTLGTHSWNVKSTKPGSISVALPSSLSDGGSNSIPGSALSSVSSTNSFSAGPTNPFSLEIKSNVTWGTAPAGTYTGTVVVTFTQS